MEVGLKMNEAGDVYNKSKTSILIGSAVRSEPWVRVDVIFDILTSFSFKIMYVTFKIKYVIWV